MSLFSILRVGIPPIDSARHNNVVNLKDHANALSGQSNGTLTDERGLNNLSGVHILNTTLFDVETSESVTVSVTIAELSHEQNRVKTGILGKSVGDKFEGFTVSAHNVRVSAENSARVDLELVSNFHLNAGTAIDE